VSPELDAEPLTNLAAGQRVRVTDGPQDGDGHRWYEVTLLPSNVVGWVAASGADGVPWLAVVGNGGLALASGASVSELDVREESRRPVAELAAGWTASQPSWSPDGDRLAVAELDFDDSLQCVLGGRVVIFDAAGTVVTRTSPPPGTYDSAPIWAPDGGAIGFMRSNACGSDQGLPALHVVAADGGPDRLIVENAIGPAWSPVGDTFAFLRLSGEQTGIPGDLRGPEIWTVAADGTGLRRLGGRADISGERERLSDRLAWAPDASLLAFSRAVGPELADVEIDVMDLEGQVRRVATVPGEVRDLTWLPDGSGLVYIEGRFLATAVVVLTPDGRETARFELTDGVPDRLIVAPDGTSLAWRIQGSALLRVQPLDGSPILIDEVEATDIAWRSVLITD
jgi:Tol biopolymer transport system component